MQNHWSLQKQEPAMRSGRHLPVIYQSTSVLARSCAIRHSSGLIRGAFDRLRGFGWCRPGQPPERNGCFLLQTAPTTAGCHPVHHFFRSRATTCLRTTTLPEPRLHKLSFL